MVEQRSFLPLKGAFENCAVAEIKNEWENTNRQFLQKDLAFKFFLFFFKTETNAAIDFYCKNDVYSL